MTDKTRHEGHVEVTANGRCWSTVFPSCIILAWNPYFLWRLTGKGKRSVDLPEGVNVLFRWVHDLRPILRSTQARLARHTSFSYTWFAMNRKNPALVIVKDDNSLSALADGYPQ